MGGPFKQAAFFSYLQDVQRYDHQDGHEQDGDKYGDVVKSGIAFAGIEVMLTHQRNPPPSQQWQGERTGRYR